MKKWTVVLLIIIGVLVLIALTLYFYLGTYNEESGEYVEVTAENLPEYLESQKIVTSLPKNADMELNFGNKSYHVTKGSVEEGTSSNPDIVVNVPEKYIGELGNGVCATLKEATSNDDLSVETSVSNGELLWKYKSMLKYRNCLSK